MMTGIKLFVIISFISCTVNYKANNLEIEEVKSYLMGEWVYSYSTCSLDTFILEIDRILPVFKMTFNNSIDSIELRGMPDYVIKSRMTNVLRNVKCTSYYDSIKVVDTYYPILIKKENGYGVLNYGKILNSSYTILALNKDKLTVSEGKVYKFNRQSNESVNHIYLKKMK